MAVVRVPRVQPSDASNNQMSVIRNQCQVQLDSSSKFSEFLNLLSPRILITCY